MRTAWGYDVRGDLAPIVSLETFNLVTGRKYVGDPRIAQALMAASQAVRSECGWHVAPSAACVAHPNGGSTVLRLPASYVSTVAGVTEDGEELSSSAYEWRPDGLMRRKDRCTWSDRWGGLEVEYTAGYDLAAVPDLVEAVCAITVGVMSVAPGLISESADGVSVSYSSSASSIAAALTSQQKNALAPYKVVNSHAA